MINIKRFVCNMLAENCYVVSDETSEAVIIDCGAAYPEEGTAITTYISENKLKPKHLICTHGHFDHCIGNGLIYNTYGLKPEVHQEDEFLMVKIAGQIEEMLGVKIALEVPPVGRYLSDNETITFGSHSLQLLNTPGHTPGSSVFYCKAEGILFSGDTLFRMSIGRTDFEGGSYQEMMASLHNVLANLPDKTKVYSGHGPVTTIGDEKMYSPYFR